MRQNVPGFIGKRGTFQNASKVRLKCAEHLWGRTPLGRYRSNRAVQIRSRVWSSLKKVKTNPKIFHSLVFSFSLVLPNQGNSLVFREFSAVSLWFSRVFTGVERGKKSLAFWVVFLSFYLNTCDPGPIYRSA